MSTKERMVVMANNIKEIRLYDGKYTVLYDEETSKIKALRNGKEWRSLVGDNLVLHLVLKIIDLEEQVEKEMLNMYYTTIGDFVDGNGIVREDIRYYNLGSHSMYDFIKMWCLENSSLDVKGTIKRNYKKPLTDDQLEGFTSDSDLMDMPFNTLFPNGLDAFLKQI